MSGTGTSRDKLLQFVNANYNVPYYNYYNLNNIYCKSACIVM